EDAARLLAEHLRGAGEPLAVEAPFEVTLGRVHLRGSIDRIEGDATGLRVVDLKSGRTAKSAAKAEEDLQLAAYQAAVREGALAEQLGQDAPERLNGAELVYVGTGGKRAAVRTQTALTRAEDPAWFDDLVREVSREVSGATVTSPRWAVRSSGPLQPEGDQLCAPLRPPTGRPTRPPPSPPCSSSRRPPRSRPPSSRRPWPRRSWSPAPGPARPRPWPPGWCG